MTLPRLFPDAWRREWERREVIRRFAGNSFWLLLEQGWRSVLAIVVGLWTARYLGPALLGDLAYAAALVALVAPLVNLGLNGIVLRDLVRSPGQRGEILGTAFGLKLAGATVSLLAAASCAWALDSGAHDRVLLVVILASGAWFQAADVVDLCFQADSAMRLPAILRMVAVTVSALLRVGLILAHAPLVAFAAVIAGESILLAGGLVLARRMRSQSDAWRWSRARAAALVREGAPWLLAMFAVQVQAQFDQVLMGSWLPAEELGRYSAALRLISMATILPMAAQAAAAPEITRAHAADAALFRRRVHDLHRLMVLLFVVTAVPFVVAPDWIARMCYGEKFAAAAAWLPWLAPRLLLAGLGMSRSLFLTNADLVRFSAVSAVVGAIVSVALNWMLIPRFGVSGAIGAGLIALTASTLLADAFHPRARTNFGLMWKAVVTPWRASR